MQLYLISVRMLLFCYSLLYHQFLECIKSKRRKKNTAYKVNMVKLRKHIIIWSFRCLHKKKVESMMMMMITSILPVYGTSTVCVSSSSSRGIYNAMLWNCVSQIFIFNFPTLHAAWKSSFLILLFFTSYNLNAI